MGICPNCGKKVSWLYEHDKTNTEVAFEAFVPDWSCDKGDDE